MANQGTYVTMNGLIIRGNQLPVSATGWQHVSQICFASLFSEKSEFKKSTTIKTTEKISTVLGSLELQEFLMNVWLNLKTIKFYLI